MPEIHDLTALELAAALRAGETSAVEVLDHTLERARTVGDRVGAFVHLTEGLAREQAAAADRLLAAHRRGADVDLPPLLGVPCPIKDLTQVAGVPFEAGCAAYAGTVAEVDDGVVTLLRRAGTIMVGKTTVPELGIAAYTEPDVAPPARTPWDLGRSAGGSSGGAGAAVAAGVVPVAHGNDGGGSIRIPAAACGLVGLKPSRGRVSPGPHGVDGMGLGVHGALTRDVRDTAAVLDVLAHHWPGDHYYAPGPGGPFAAACDREVTGLRVGLLLDPVVVADAPVHREARAAAERAARRLEGLGHHVEPAPVPFLPEDWEAFMAVWAVGALLAPVPEGAEDLLTPLTRWLRAAGRGVSGLDLAQALAGMQRLSRQAWERWSGFDVVVSPTLAQPPAPLGSLRDDRDPAGDFAAQKAFTPWGSVWNILGAPAISLPLHWAPAADGGPVLPFGVMLGARTGQEELLLGLAAALEAAEPWARRRPPVW